MKVLSFLISSVVLISARDQNHKSLNNLLLNTSCKSIQFPVIILCSFKDSEDHGVVWILASLSIVYVQ